MFVIPMAGRSQRFFDAGYRVPKYELRIEGASLFALAVSSFERYFREDEFLFVVRHDSGAEDFVRAEIDLLGISNYEVVVLESETAGQAETVYKGVRHVGPGEPLYIFNIDTIRPGYVKPRFVESCDGYLEVFRGEGSHWSFVRPGPTQTVRETAEKNRISDLCSDGLYYFGNKQMFENAFLDAVGSSARVQGEYYIAPLYNYLIGKGCVIRYDEVHSDEVMFCGTPAEYEALRAFSTR